MHPLKKILNLLHPVLKSVSRWYLSKTRSHTYKNITIKIFPGVFHPGLFLSTKVFLEYLETQPLVKKNILELGAGSGLISIYCAKKGAHVTASDISKTALENIRLNAQLNKVEIKIIESNLFQAIGPTSMDLVIVNPPYYPKEIKTEEDLAWFCGTNFDYFENFFRQLKDLPDIHTVLIIFSEDCDLKKIDSIAHKHHCTLRKVYMAKKWGEENFIFEIQR